VSDDGSRPQRRQATKPVQARAPVTSSGTLTGVASYYWQPQPLASGGRFNPDAMTAAHKTLPFGTRVRVTRADTGRSVEVVINDRGPYIAGRIIDLSRRAAQEIGMTDVGVTKVNVAILGR
jgi:rare lipoprotein A